MKKHRASNVNHDVNSIPTPRDTLKKAILSAATLIQGDPEIGEDTLDFLDSDIRCALEAIIDLQDEAVSR